MEMFDVHRRDILSFDNYMDLKKPGFGGPASAKQLRDQRGNKINKEPKLADYQRTVERDPAFSHPVWNPTYKAMSHDLVYKQEKKKPYTYTDPYLTAVPVIELDDVVAEGRTYSNFNHFINEAMDLSLEDIERELLSYEEDESFGANPMTEIPDLEDAPDDFKKWFASVNAGSNPFEDDYYEEDPDEGYYDEY